jgi:uncharacterized protein YjiS (DUF1127 family)
MTTQNRRNDQMTIHPLVRLARQARAWAGEELRYRQALRELRQLDDRDLDDLALGRADLPGLARQHARSGV